MVPPDTVLPVCQRICQFLNTPLPLDILEYSAAQDIGGVAGVARGDD